MERALLAQAVDGDAGDDIAGQPLEGAELREVGLAAMVAAGGGGRAARLGRAVEGSVDGGGRGRDAGGGLVLAAKDVPVGMLASVLLL